MIDLNEAGFVGSVDVQFEAPGVRYFVCQITGHCSGNQKLQVNVEAAGPAAPTAAPTAPTAAPSATPTAAPGASSGSDGVTYTAFVAAAAAAVGAALVF